MRSASISSSALSYRLRRSPIQRWMISLRWSLHESRGLRRCESARGVALHQHPQQLPDLVDVVARLPLGHCAVDDLAWRRQRVHRARGDPATVALLPDDAEVAELEAAPLAHEDVDRRQVAVQDLAAVQLAEHLAGCPRSRGARPLRPALARTTQVTRPDRRARAYSSARQYSNWPSGRARAGSDRRCGSRAGAPSSSWPK